MGKIMWFGVIIITCIHRRVSAEDSKTLLGTGAREDDDTNYCDKQWKCGPFKHFMCEYEKNKKTDKCSNIVIGISDKERIEILKLVNEFRNNLGSGEDGAFPDGAENIRQITWDHKLESFAEVYGSQCGSSYVLDLDPCAKTTDFHQGTRLLWGIIENGIEDVITGTDGWTSDIPDPDVIQSFQPVEGDDRLEPNYSRFTLLAWAATYKMGCSIIDCTCTSLPQGSKKLVCFFGPSGNIGGQPVFFSGEACKSCPADTSCNRKSAWPKLCARKGDPDNIKDILGLATSIRSPYILYYHLLAAILLSDKS